MAPSWLPPVIGTFHPLVGGFGASFAGKENLKWYDAQVKKPWWTPPNYVFGPVWASLYASMGYASYLVWEACDGFNDRSLVPLGLYGTQLALNWAWTPIFFGWHKLGLATIEIGATWLAIVGCVVTFHPVSKTASYLMLPYLGWVSFASCLTFWIWRNNPSKKVD
ncbi:PREDICTED: translocator protein-like [Branchiostoma belcheri]|uniref:Translocator protein-like n=1 Tax=Branchiostoma belcheri TaxID=7741 RepID=A0A6P5AWP2_BRABE|nr:PREDICTED: translocator protein-like [Branchiostoma belcheri]